MPHECPIGGERYGVRSSDALPLAISNGIERWSGVTSQMPSRVREQMVARHYIPMFPP